MTAELKNRNRPQLPAPPRRTSAGRTHEGFTYVVDARSTTGRLAVRAMDRSLRRFPGIQSLDKCDREIF